MTKLEKNNLRQSVCAHTLTLHNIHTNIHTYIHHREKKYPHQDDQENEDENAAHFIDIARLHS